MASPQKTTGHRDRNRKSEVPGSTRDWEPARHQEYYASRALPMPPRPDSSSPSIYDSEDGNRRQPTPNKRLTASSNNNDYTDARYCGPFDEVAYDMIRSQPGMQQEVVSPQPIQPGHPGLLIPSEHDEMEISPVTPPTTGNNLWMSYAVSPLSDATSEIDRMLLEMSNEPWGTDDTSRQADRRHSEFGKNYRMHDAPDSLHHQIQKLNLRHSDPGSPTSAGPGARGLGPRLDVSGSLPTNVTAGIQPLHIRTPREGPTTSLTPRHLQVAFAGPKIDSFSKRSDPTASPSRVAPPPLKLRERPLAGHYVKTPFPPQADSEASQKGASETSDLGLKKRTQNRVSSFGSLRRPQRAGSSPRNEARNTPATQEVRPIDVLARASPVPKVKNILSRAKQGLGISSDEDKKERRKEEFKRKIRLTPGEA